VGTTHTLAARPSGNFFTAAAQCTSEVDEAGLLERARAGDAKACAALFARYQGPIFRYAAHMCGRDAADDVVQETFLAVLRSGGRYDPDRGPVAAYLFGIARHAVFARIGHAAGAGLVEPLDGCTACADAPTALETLTRAETIDAVRAAIASLPPVYREAIVLCELQEMSYDGAAAVVGCPVGTIRSRLHRAKVLLMAKLSALAAPAAVRR
jgi:RNA polymerase sigma-70 factor (ECF subfamily)